MQIYPVDKPLGLTSHDVVATLRRQLGTRRVGHAGTLDPLATGVLVLLVGEATKLSPYLTSDSKEYLAWVAFGGTTPTLDAEGPLANLYLPAAADLTSDLIARAAAGFLGRRQQAPPAYSAVKTAGVPSYARARRGEAEEPPEREVHYEAVTLLGFARTATELPAAFAPTPSGWRPAAGGRQFELPPALAPLPTALLSLRVSAGTYVRSFARDLGAALGVPAHLAGLVRTAAGRVDLSQCVPLTGALEGAALSPQATLSQPQLTVPEQAARALRHGQRIRLPVSGVTAVFGPQGELVAMVTPAEDADEGQTATAAETTVPVRVLRAWQR